MNIKIGSHIVQIVHPDALKPFIGRSLTKKEMREYNQSQRDKQTWEDCSIKQSGVGLLFVK